MKKLLSFFALSAIVLGMASCGDGNNPEIGPEPEVKNIQFKVNTRSARMRIEVTASDPNTYFFVDFNTKAQIIENYGGEVENYVKAQFENISPKDLLNYFCFKDHHVINQNVQMDTKYVVLACYVKVSEDQVEVDGEIFTQEFTTMPEFVLGGEFTVDDQGKKVHFYSSNLGKYPAINNDFLSNDQWFCYGNCTDNSKVHDLLQWNTMTDLDMDVLTAAEWWYLFRERDNAEQLFAHATITVEGNDIHGIILLPDNWETPDGIQLTTSYAMEIRWDSSKNWYMKDDFDGYGVNTFDTNQWKDLELAGAVFLPAGGSSGNNKNLFGWYWTSTPADETNAHAFSFGTNNLYLISLKGDVRPKTSYYSIRPVRKF